MKDFYYILGIDANSTLIEIKEAYRKLSKKFHPDLNGNDNYFENRFKEIQEAYEILSDPVKRQRYDAAFAAFKAGNTTELPKRSRSGIIWIDILFTLVLISITIVFGAYVKNAMSGPPLKKTILLATLNSTSPAIIKHHKKRYNLKLKLADNSVNQAVVLAHPVGAVAVPHSNPAPPPVKIAAIKPAVAPVLHAVQPRVVIIPAKQAMQETADDASTHKNFLYATYIRSNVTGVTNMHQSGSFSSAVVAAIPTNSQVYVLEKGDSYYKVLYNNSTGYVPKWALKAK